MTFYVITILAILGGLKVLHWVFNIIDGWGVDFTKLFNTIGSMLSYLILAYLIYCHYK